MLPRPSVLSTQTPAAHELDEAQRDREAQAGAAVAPRRRAVGLRERLKDCPLLVLRNADAGVADGEVKRHASALARLDADAQHDFAFGR